MSHMQAMENVVYIQLLKFRLKAKKVCTRVCIILCIAAPVSLGALGGNTQP